MNEKGRGELPCLIGREPSPGAILGIRGGADVKADALGRVGAAAEGEMAYPDLPAARGPDADVMAGALGAGSPAGHGMPPPLLALAVSGSDAGQSAGQPVRDLIRDGLEFGPPGEGDHDLRVERLHDRAGRGGADDDVAGQQ